jgi:predicted ABC-type ATPase
VIVYKKTMDNVSERQKNELISKLIRNKKPVTKYFIIKYGPPASGKGGIMKQLLPYLHISDNSLITVEIDSILAELPQYVDAVHDIRSDSNLSEEQKQTALGNVYWSTRKGAGGDQVSDDLLNEALMKGYNVAWETTGATVAWTIKEIKRISKMGYTVVIAYPIVPTSTLISRSKIREKSTGQLAAPAKQIESDVEKSATNVTKLLPYVDKLIIYDNSRHMGEEIIALEVMNEYDWTTENNKPGPGWKQTTWCDCKDLETIRHRFGETVIKLFENCDCNN